MNEIDNVQHRRRTDDDASGAHGAGRSVKGRMRRAGR